MPTAAATSVSRATWAAAANVGIHGKIRLFLKFRAKAGDRVVADGRRGDGVDWQKKVRGYHGLKIDADAGKLSAGADAEDDTTATSLSKIDRTAEGLA